MVFVMLRMLGIIKRFVRLSDSSSRSSFCEMHEIKIDGW